VADNIAPPTRQLKPLGGETGQEDPRFGFRYSFNVLTRPIRGQFSKVSGLSEEIEVVEMRDGTDPFQVRKIAGTNQGGQITLERGIVSQRDHLIRWFGDVKKKSGQYWADVTVGVWGRPEDKDTVMDVKIRSGWPSRYEIGDLDAKSSEIAVEVLTVVHEGLEYVR